MTRINVICPSMLLDQHLLAELRELPRIGSLVRNYVEKGKGYQHAYDLAIKQEHYTLGTGHVTFFYNKGDLLYQRYKELHKEASRRAFNVQFRFNDPWTQYGLKCDRYDIDIDDEYINVHRLKTKFMMKVNYYKHYGNVMGAEYLTALTHYLERYRKENDRYTSRNFYGLVDNVLSKV